MRRTTFLALSLILSFLGIADSWYLAEHALTNTALSCGLGTSLSGCNTVAQSAYSHFFGIPLGLYGVGFYALVFIVSSILLATHSRRLVKILFMLSVFGVLFSIYFVGLQIFIIKALCIYCIGSFLISVGIFISSLSLTRQTKSIAPPLP